MSKNGFRHFRNWDAPVTSPFGYRGAVYKDGKLLTSAGGHNGVDYGTDCKKIPVYALEDGIVRLVYTDPNGAKTVYVEYPRLGHIGWYCHFDEVRVSKGQAVNKDTILGIAGMTGLATGVHLHFSWFPIADYGKWNKERYEDFEQYEYPSITASTTQSISNIVGKILVLPASAPKWRVYPLDKKPVVGNECGFILPAKFGGLEYEILGQPYPDVVTIQTRDFGKVNIYVHPSTLATIK